MIVSKFILTPLSSLGLCDAKLEGYKDESAPLFLCVHPNNCPCGVFAVHTQLNNNICNYFYLIKHFPSTLSLVVFFWASTRTAMNSIYLPLLTYLKWSNNLVLHYTPLLCCLSGTIGYILLGIVPHSVRPPTESVRVGKEIL